MGKTKNHNYAYIFHTATGNGRKSHNLTGDSEQMCQNGEKGTDKIILKGKTL